MKSRISIFTIVLVSGLGVAGCSSTTATESPSGAPAQSPSGGTEQSSAFCDGLVDLNTQAESMAQSLTGDSTVRAAVTIIKDLAIIAARVEVVAEREGGANGAKLQVAG